jgi:hypothetical protein
MGFLLSSIIRLNGMRFERALNRAVKRPAQQQEKLLLDIVKKNKDTEYGGKYFFGSIRNNQDFKRSVPVIEYSDIEPYVEKLKNGQRNVLTSDPTFMFSLTSGTTATPKYIPITRKGQRRTEQLMQQWLSRAIFDHPSFFNQKFLGITGAAIEGYCASKIPFGSASGMINSTMPGIVKKTFAAPLCVSSITDYDLRYYVMARLIFEQSISFIATPNPLTLIKLTEVFQRRAEEILRSMHNGWLSDSIRSDKDYSDSTVPCEIRSWVKPNKARAFFLGKVLERAGSLKSSDCWPELALVGCWLGGSIGFHLDALKQFFGETPKRDIGYMASEGCITLPFEDSNPGGILALENNFYEFIPESQIDLAAPDILSLNDLKEGSFYKILLTNENGLYRYDINDIIHVDGFYHQTPVISFARKSGNITSIAGEKLHLTHILLAIKKVQSRFGIAVNQFRVVPDLPGLRYEMFFDIGAETSKELLRSEVLPALDAYLCEANIEYNAKRKSKRLNPPLFHVMNQSWTADVCKAHGQFDKRDVQHKWIQLAQAKVEADNGHIQYSIQGTGA